MKHYAEVHDDKGCLTHKLTQQNIDDIVSFADGVTNISSINDGTIKIIYLFNALLRSAFEVIKNENSKTQEEAINIYQSIVNNFLEKEEVIDITPYVTLALKVIFSIFVILSVIALIVKN